VAPDLRATVTVRRDESRVQTFRIVKSINSPGSDGRSVVIGGNVQCLIGWRVRQLERIGNGAAGDLAIVDIETITQMQVIMERPPPPLVGEREDK